MINSKGTEEEQREKVLLLEQKVPHPAITGLMYYSDEELTAEEIVEQALGYKPIQLSCPTNRLILECIVIASSSLFRFSLYCFHVKPIVARQEKCKAITMNI